MKIDLNEITVRDLVKDYSDDGEGGVRGYGPVMLASLPGEAWNSVYKWLTGGTALVSELRNLMPLAPLTRREPFT